MGYGINLSAFGVPLDNTGSDKFQDLDTDKLEPKDSARKQIHVGGESTIFDIVISGGAGFSAVSDGARSGVTLEAYNATNINSPAILGTRGRGTVDSPEPVQSGDVLFFFGASGINESNQNSVLTGQVNGFLVTMVGAPSGGYMPMAFSINTQDGEALKVYPGRDIMLGSGSTVPEERLGIKSGRIEMEETTAPTQRSGWGKFWVSSTDSLPYFMDDSGNTYKLTGGGIDPDTEATLLASTPSGSGYVIATDTQRGLYYDADNTQWYITSIPLAEEDSNPDSGSENGNSDKNGYGENYIDNKKATDFGIGAFNGIPYNGAVRVRSDVFPSKAAYYIDGAWQDVPLDIAFANANYTHLPTGYKIDVRSGNSSGKVGLNGIPNVREYQVDSGSTPRHVIIDGGEI